MCIFFGEGDLQLNGLMIKAIAGFFFFIFFSLPSSTAEQDGMWEGEGWLGTERLRSTKPFWLLKIFLASLIAPVAGGPAFRREHLLHMWLPDNLFASKPPLFVIWEWDKEQERSMPAEQWFSQAWGANGKDACVVKGWKGIKKQRNKQRNKKSRSLSPPEAVNLPFFSLLWYLWKLLLRRTERGFCQKRSLQMSSDPFGGISAPNTAVTFSPPL